MRMRPSRGLVFHLLLISFGVTIAMAMAQHTSNHAVILSSSRYWFNYRHTANALSIYQMLRSSGFQDDHVVLMIADEYGVNPRNPVKNHLYNTASDSLQKQQTFYNRPSLLNDETVIDYRGEDVTVDNFVRVLTGRSGNNGQIMPVLQSNEQSNVLIYLTGHGGDQFFKFQDVEEILAEQLAETVHQMGLARKYNQLFIMADTCQAFTLFDKMIDRDLPNVTVIGSSLRDQSSYAHTADAILGLSVIEKYTHFFTEQIRTADSSSVTLFDALVGPYTKERLGAHLGYAFTTGARNLTEVPLRDFFVYATNDSIMKTDVPKARLLENESALFFSSTTAASSSSSSLSKRQSSRNRRTRLVENDSETCAFANEEGQCIAKACNSTAPIYSLFQKIIPSLPGTEPDHPIFVAVVVVLLSVSLLASRIW